MRRTLFVSVACLALACGEPARAVLPVTDTASIAQRGLEAGRALEQAIQQWDTMKSQLSQLQATVGALSHPNQALGIARGLLQQGVQNPGAAAASIPGLTYGSHLATGADRFVSQNRAYAPQGDDFAAQEMRRREQVTANIQAQAQAGMDTADQRTAALRELQASIGDQPDVTAVSAVEARLSSEQAFLANESNNVARLQLLQRSADRVDAQRAEQAGRQEADDWHTAAAAAAFGE